MPIENNLGDQVFTSREKPVSTGVAVVSLAGVHSIDAIIAALEIAIEKTFYLAEIRIVGVDVQTMGIVRTNGVLGTSNVEAFNANPNDTIVFTVPEKISTIGLAASTFIQLQVKKAATITEGYAVIRGWYE